MPIISKAQCTSFYEIQSIPGVCNFLRCFRLSQLNNKSIFISEFSFALERSQNICVTMLKLKSTISSVLTSILSFQLYRGKSLTLEKKILLTLVNFHECVMLQCIFLNCNSWGQSHSIACRVFALHMADQGLISSSTYVPLRTTKSNPQEQTQE